MRSLSRLTFFVSLILSCPLLAQPSYFVAMFASQYGTSTKDGLIDIGNRNPPEHSHTFATFFEAEDGRITDVRTISWLPADGVVRGGPAVPGRNFELLETLDWAMKDGENLFAWGPYPTTPELFEKAKAQAKHLDTGFESYKMIDFTLRAYRVANCIHAAAEVVAPLATTRFARGILASYRVLNERYASYITSLVPQREWLTALGAARYPLQYLDR